MKVNGLQASASGNGPSSQPYPRASVTEVPRLTIDYVEGDHADEQERRQDGKMFEFPRNADE